MTSNQSFLAGGGEMGERMRALDWSRTALGPVAGWPPSLRTALSIMLGSRYPMFLWWGPSLVNFYNDGYIPVLGKRHPRSLGANARELWAEIWHVVGPEADGVMQTGKATWNERQLLVMERNGFVEETYFSWSYSPARDESGAIAGVFCACTEDTRRVLGERRMRTLREVAADAHGTQSARAACEAGLRAMEKNRHDLPFAALYLADGAGRGRLGAAMGWENAPPAIDMAPLIASGMWPLAPEGVATPGAPWPEPVSRALAVPITQAGSAQAAGLLVAGVSPRLALDDDYRSFVDILAGQMARAIADAETLETERRRAEALAEIDRAKTAFFSNVSHELRTPLTLMLGPLEDGLNDAEAPLPGAQRERLELALRSGLRLQKLVNSLLDFSRIEAGRAQATYAPTDLAALTADLASSFRSAIEKAGLELAVDCPPLAEPAYVDRDMWEKIVLNLLSNAFKHTFEGKISVELRNTDSRFELRVRDTGTGIPAAELPHVFERFRRVEGAKSRTHEGTGIGLALVLELAKLHGGTIGAQSVEGKGSTFTVSIPAGQAHLPADRVGAAGELAPTRVGAEAFVEEAMRWLPDSPGGPVTAEEGKRARIVWADDNADMREYVRKLLSARYEVEAVADGEAALAAVRARHADLVLADVMMPRLDGLGLLRALRADPKTRTIPAIVLSARAGEEGRIEGLDAGADDYLTKPFSARELLARVGACLETARIRADAEHALRESEERFRLMADAVPVMIWVSDVSKACTWFNRGWLDFAGRPMEALVGDGWAKDVHPEDLERCLGIYSTHFEARQPFSMEYRLRRHDGQYRWVLDNGTPRFDVGGAFAGYIGSCIDTTERKRAEDELREADRRKDEFMAMLAHELRNPLSAIALGADLLKRAKLDDPKARFAAPAIERQAKQLQRLADDMLDIARATYGKLTLKRERIDLLAVAKAAAAAHAAKATVEVSGDTAWVDGDAARLQQVIGNLIDNAVKYGGRNIEVRINAGARQTRLSVQDDGQGIAPELLPELFKPFVQGAQPLDRAQGGLGLGLALVERLVALHGGNVAAHSLGVGKGSTFTVSLPSASRPPAGAKKASPVRAVERRRVLVVEDEKDVREMLRVLLESEGHEVSVADSGTEGLARFGSFRPDVALVDIGLPGMDGYEVARQARSLPEGGRFKLIAITGYGQDKDRQRARDAGFDLHITKPVMYEQLVRAFES